MTARQEGTFSIKQAAQKAGISEGLLIFWISVGRFEPSIELSMRSSDFPNGSIEQKALAAFAGPDGEAFGWNRFILTEENVERLRSMAERTAEKKAKAETSHVKGTHFTVQELAKLWGLSVDKIRELFENEPDVIKIQSLPKKGKRRYTTLRIPEPVAARVQRRIS
jgi:hypothetical protein